MSVQPITLIEKADMADIALGGAFLWTRRWQGWLL